ncbi:hypothetical protein DN069_30035 [Streptacidiphilus pinicola]|uniref:Transposase DDE domain-containing protein n=1 Tax=Streptacidiphilus pinicola TaxID=2219663 RepID=A0A2X0IEB4_9ACTN|nr:hypothetical protein DN069_30035 [Streptacidiphilus pinicola]
MSATPRRSRSATHSLGAPASLGSAPSRRGLEPDQGDRRKNRELCISGFTRRLTLHPREEHELLQQQRAEQETPGWRQRYGRRAGVEGTIHQAVHTTGIRTNRYRGLARTGLAHVLSAAALDLAATNSTLPHSPWPRACPTGAAGHRPRVRTDHHGPRVSVHMGMVGGRWSPGTRPGFQGTKQAKPIRARPRATLNALPWCHVLSTNTAAARPAIQARFITPTTISTTIRPQQQPTQYPP